MMADTLPDSLVPFFLLPIQCHAMNSSTQVHIQLPPPLSLPNEQAEAEMKVTRCVSAVRCSLTIVLIS